MIIISFDVGTRNLALCILGSCDGGGELEEGNNDDEHMSVLAWNVFDLKNGSTSALRTDILVERLIDTLYEYFIESGMLVSLASAHPDTNFRIVIERQPRKASSAMLSVQMAISSFFRVLRRASIIPPSTISRVEFISPGIKLRASDGYDPPALDSSGENRASKKKSLARSKGQRYRYNKTWVQSKVHTLIHTGTIKCDEAVIHAFSNSKKKDDYCDALWQAWCVVACGGDTTV